MNRRLFYTVFCPLLCGAFYLWLNVPVFNTSYDQLHELAGAANLFEGNGYVVTGDMSAQSWPPFYSAYIAAWPFLRDTFATVAVANAVLISLAAMAWAWSVRAFAGRFAEFGANRLPHRARAQNWLEPIAMIGVQLTLLDILRFPSAPAIFAIFLPLFLITLIRLAVDGLTVRRVIGFVILSILFANSHNIAPIVIFTFDIVFGVMLVWRCRFSETTAIALGALSAAVSWFGVRWVFSLSGAHQFSGLFASGRALTQALSDVTTGAADALMPPWVIGMAIMVAVVTMALRSPTGHQRRADQAALACVLAGGVFFYAILLVVFMSVPIDSDIDGRFLLVGFLVFWWLLPIVDLPPSRVLIYLLLFAFLLPLANRTARLGKWAARVKIAHVYQRHDYVVSGGEKVTIANIKDISNARCTRSACAVPHDVR